MVASNAARSSVTRSAGTPGGASTGRSMFCTTIINSSCARISSSRTNSITAGVSGRSARRHADLAFGEPAGMQRLERGEMGAAAAVELAALHREIDVATGLVACDHLDPGRKQLVQHRRVELHLRTR